VLFSIVFIGLVLVAATFSTAESARLADEGVLHSIHQQQHDWSKTQQISQQGTDGSAGVAAIKKVDSLEGNVAKLQAALASLKASRRRSTGSSWKHSESYTDEVERKERAEEKHIEKRASQLAKESSKVDVVGLDAAHRKVLREMKDKIHEQNEEARVKGEQDYLRREKEIDSLLPSDTNCPGPDCLVSRSPHASARAAERPMATRKVRITHRHPPWHRHYPPEFHNVYNSKDMPWLNDAAPPPRSPPAAHPAARPRPAADQPPA